MASYTHALASESSKRTMQRTLVCIIGIAILVLLVCTFFVSAGAAIEDISSKSDLENLCKNGGEGRLTADIEYYFKVKKDKSVVLDLNGHHITPMYPDSSHLYATFRVDKGGSLTIRDTAGGGYIADRDADDGGGVRVKEGATFILESGTIKDCWSYTGGGAVLLDEDAKFYMKGGLISKCGTSHGGGAVYVQEGATFEMSGNATIEGCNAGIYGGAVDVKGGTFTMKDNAVITGCYMNDKYTDIEDEDNYASADKRYGGGVAVRDSGTFTMEDNATIDNCKDNYPKYDDWQYLTPSWYAGGGGVGVIDGGTFTMKDNAVISNCKCENKYKRFFGGGGVYVDGGTFKMESGTITGCDVTSLFNDLGEYSGPSSHCGRGGGVYVQSGTVDLRNGVISDSKAIYGGGVCIFSGVSIMMENMTLENCVAQSPYNADNAPNEVYGCGGGMYFGVGSFPTLRHCSFINCLAESAGGAIDAGCMENDDTCEDEINAYIENCTFSGNHCNRIGGAVAFCPVAGGTVTFSQCDFSDNSADYGAGAMVVGSSDWWVVPTKFSCILCKFINNTAINGNGGAMTICMSGVYAQTASITDCTFEDNVAGSSLDDPQSGGAIYITNIYTGNTDYPTVVEYPEAPRFQIVIPPTTVSDAIQNIVVNTLNKLIDSLYDYADELNAPDDRKYQVDQTLTISGSTFRNNVAYGEGGAIDGENWAEDGFANYMAATKYYVSGSTFSGNRALGSNGGAIAVNETTSYDGTSSIVVDLVGDTITGNTAKTNGGGVYLLPEYSTYSTTNEHKAMKITGNTLEGSSLGENNVYVSANGTIRTLSKETLSTDSIIGITTEIKPESKIPGKGVTFYAGDTNLISVFYSDDEYYAVVPVKRDNQYYLQLIQAEMIAEVSNVSGAKTQYPTLSLAVDAVQPGETITLLKSFSENVIVDTANPFTLDTAGKMLTSFDAEKPVLTINSGADVTITGNGKIYKATGDNQVSAVSIASGAKVTLKQITLSENGGVTGGAVNNAGTLIVDGAVFISNSASYGGAVYNTGSMTVSSGTFSSNSAPSGGAIYNLGTLQVAGGSITGNVATKGGAIYHGGSTLVLSGTPTISNNMNASAISNNIFLADAENRPIICDGLTATGIGITSQQVPPQNITTPSSVNYARCFKSDVSGYWIESVDVAGKYLVRLGGDPEGEYVTVSYDTFGYSMAPQSQTIPKFAKVTEPPVPTASGYRFDGWYRDINCTVSYVFGLPVANSLVLYANWTKVWVVNYDMKGVGTAPAGSPLEVENGTVITEPAAPTADGYEFVNWTSDYAGEILYNFAEPIVADTTIYAQWLKNCSVTFAMRGHGSQVPTQYVIEGGNATRPSPDPTEDGYIFDDWYDERNQLFDFNTTIKDDITLHARWIQIQYLVRFDTDGGSNVTPQRVGYGDLVREPMGVSKDESILTGWKNGTADWDFARDRVYANLTLTAQWVAKDDLYLVRAAAPANGTIYVSTAYVESVSTAYAKQGSTVNITVVAAEGAKITGLSVQNKSGSSIAYATPVTDAHDTVWTSSFTMPKDAVLVYATILDQYSTVTFDAAGGTVTPLNETVEYGGYVSMPSASSVGHVITGWMNGSVPWNFATDKVYADTTLVAQWVAASNPQYAINLTSSADATVYCPASTATPGTLVNLSIRADTGSIVDALTVVNESTGLQVALNVSCIDQTVWVANFTMPEGAVRVTGSASAKMFTVTYYGNGGKVNPMNATVAYGSLAPIPSAANRGYDLVGWMNDSRFWDFATDKVYDNLTLTAKWTLLPPDAYHTIALEPVPAVGNASVGTLYCPVKAAPMDRIIPLSFATTGLFGVQVPTVTDAAGNPVAVTTTSMSDQYWNGTFTMPASNVTISASAVKIYMSVSSRTIAGKEYGEFTATPRRAKEGATVTFTAVPDAGYEVVGNTIWINTEKYTLDSSGNKTYTVGTTNVVGTLSFGSNVHRIIRDNTEFGTQLMVNKSIASPNEMVQILAVPGNRKAVSQFYYINVTSNERTNVSAGPALLVNGSVGTFSMPAADVIVGVDLEYNLSSGEYLVTTDPVQNGKILSRFYGAADSPQYIVTAPDSGYAVKPESVSVKTVSSNAAVPVTQLNTNQFSFTMPDADVIITAAFSSTSQQPSSPSSGGQSGSTVIIDETPVPTQTPTQTPTVAPTRAPTLDPTTVPTPVAPSGSSSTHPTQPTQKSPAPFAGLIAGLGAAAVFFISRRK